MTLSLRNKPKRKYWQQKQGGQKRKYLKFWPSDLFPTGNTVKPITSHIVTMTQALAECFEQLLVRIFFWNRSFCKYFHYLTVWLIFGPFPWETRPHSREYTLVEFVSRMYHNLSPERVCVYQTTHIHNVQNKEKRYLVLKHWEFQDRNLWKRFTRQTMLKVKRTRTSQKSKKINSAEIYLKTTRDRYRY
jgi:hypothetical protein